jgi:hypothetical protein
MARDVFISHCRSDAGVAEALCVVLENAGITSWIAPRDLQPGANFAVELLRAIDSSQAVVLVFSTQANASPFVLTEINRAFSRCKAIFTFRTEDTLPSDDLEFYLARHQWADGFPPPLVDRAICVAEAILAFLGRAVPKGVPKSKNSPSRGTAPRFNGRPFDEDGKLKLAEFAFPLSAVLLRAAKRRNIEGRSQASPSDLLAGLVRVGGLTRFVLHRAGCVPDELYAQFQPRAFSVAAQADYARMNSEPPGKDDLEPLLARWVLARRRDFTPELINLLEIAGSASDSQITELGVLERLLDSSTWVSSGVSLPERPVIRRILDDRLRTGEVDENGALPLHDCDAAAREVILHAHALAQRCQSLEITHRLFMAAFVSENAFYALGICRDMGVDAKLLWAMLVSLSRKKREGHATVIDMCLTPAVCERIVTPTLMKARELASDRKSITEAELFHAFAATADAEFLEFLRSPTETEGLETTEIDLREVNLPDVACGIFLTRLTLRARGVIRNAHQLAQERGVFPISNRLVLAAFLTVKSSFTRRVFVSRRMPTTALLKGLLSASGSNGPLDFALDDVSGARIVKPMIDRALELANAGGFVTERLLFQAYCDVAAPALKRQLTLRGIDLDLLRDWLLNDGSPSPGISTGEKSTPESLPGT